MIRNSYIFRLSTFYPHIYVTLSYLNLYTNFGGRIFSVSVYFGNINGWQKYIQSLSSTNKTLGALGASPNGIKNIISLTWFVLPYVRTLSVWNCNMEII